MSPMNAARLFCAGNINYQRRRASRNSSTLHRWRTMLPFATSRSARLLMPRAAVTRLTLRKSHRLTFSMTLTIDCRNRCRATDDSMIGQAQRHLARHMAPPTTAGLRAIRHAEDALWIIYDRRKCLAAETEFATVKHPPCMSASASLPARAFDESRDCLATSLSSMLATLRMIGTRRPSSVSTAMPMSTQKSNAIVGPCAERDVVSMRRRRP
jgi:hypothetical protein